MTENKKIREVNIEFERVRVISNLKKVKKNCETCGSNAEFISLPNASQIFEISESNILRQAYENSVHIEFEGENETLVCLASLMLMKDRF